MSPPPEERQIHACYRVEVVKILDRYLIRETLGPFSLALGLFTFLLAVKPVLAQAQLLLAKGVDLPTIGFLLLTMLPQALAVTVPMAFLAGLLMACGRLSGDREAVALQACGVSPLRLLRPVILMALLAGTADFYLLAELVPDANQRFRVETTRLLAQKGESDIKPGIFYEGFPGKVLYVRGTRPEGGWTGVMLADTSQPGRPLVTLAPAGFLEIDEAARQVSIVLPGESVRYVPGNEEGVYDMAVATDLRFAISADSVFGSGDMMPARGLRELDMAALVAAEEAKRTAGVSPHPEIIQRHQMFSFPVSCLVFALLGLALGLHTRKEGKLGGFTLGIAVIAGYYAVMVGFESLTKGGDFPAVWARWMPNLVLGLAGIAALWWRTRTTGGDLSITLPAWVRMRRAASPATHARSGGARVPKTAVVIRIPHLAIPTPRLLDMYVARHYLGLMALASVGLLALYYVGTFIDKSERLFKGQADGWMLLEYFYYSTPQFIVHVAPMAALVAALATIGGLTRTSEITVMRACGVSLYRAAAPLMVLAVVWSGGLFLLDDRVLAHANRRAEVLDDTIRGNPPHTVNQAGNANWLADASGRLYYYTAFDTRDRTLYGLSVFETSAEPFRLARHVMAGSATFSAGAWTARSGWVQDFPAPGRVTRSGFRERELGLAPPENFSGMHNQEAQLMTFGELRAHIQRLSESGINLAESRVRLQERMAFPLVTIVMTLLGVAFGATIGRRGALYGVGLAIILGAGYWMLSTFFLAVGQADLLPPVLAAWAANLLFLALAAYMTLTVRT